MRCSVIVISHNACSLGQLTCYGLRQALEIVGSRSSEIVMFDNGSSDDSARSIQTWTRQEPNFKFIAGAATVPVFEAQCRAAREARSDLLFFLDIDDLAQLSRLEEYLAASRRCEILHGVRRTRTPGARAFASAAFNGICRSILPDCIHDIGYNFYITRKSSLELLRNLSSTIGVPFVPLLIRRVTESYSEIEVDSAPNGRSSSSVAARVRLGVQAVRDALRLQRGARDVALRASPAPKPCHTPICAMKTPQTSDQT